MSFSFAVMSAWVLLSAPSDAGAAPLRVTAEDCPGLQAPEVQRLVALELTAVTQEIRKGPPLEVRLQCAGPDLRIDVRDPMTGKVLQRSIPAPVDEPGQERVVALAISQLFAASWLELLMLGEPEEDGVEGRDASGPRPSAGTSNAAVEAARRVAEEKTASPRGGAVELLAGAGVRGRSLEQAAFPSGHAEAQLRGWLVPSVGLALAVGFDVGRADRDLGRARGYAVTGGGGVTWRWRPRPRVGLGGYVFVLGGWARVAGESQTANVLTGSNQGATGEVAAGVGPRVFTGRFRMDVDAEVGGMLRTPEGTVEGGPSVTMGGLWVGLSVRVGADLSRRAPP